MLEKSFDMTKRRCVPRKKLGSKRIDLPLSKKKEYLRLIITLKQPKTAVRKIYMKEFGKILNHNTFLYSSHKRKNKFTIEYVEILTIFENVLGFGQKPQIRGPQISGSRLYQQKMLHYKNI